MLIHQVEPEYGADLAGNFVLDRVKVQMVIDAEGVPFSVTAERSLPHTVVQAMAQWRFRPGARKNRPVPSTVELIMPVRRVQAGGDGAPPVLLAADSALLKGKLASRVIPKYPAEAKALTFWRPRSGFRCALPELFMDRDKQGPTPYP